MASDELDELGFGSRRRGSNWDAPFLPPPAPPAPYAESSSYSMDNNYPQFNYNNFSDVGPPPMHLRQDMNLPPAPPAPNISWGQPPSHVTSTQEEQIKREAIESEMRNQCATLALQKEEYLRKASVLKREIETLKDQRTELRGDSRRSPSPESQRFLKENARLQGKLLNKLKTVNSVIEMLNGIIENNPAFSEVLASSNDKGKSRKQSGQRSTTKSPSPKNSSSDNDKHTSRRSKHKSSSGSEKKFNYAYYDPELHWCRICNEFPSTAKDYLTHLHTPQHHRAAAEFMETPWHNSTNQNEGFPSFPGAPIKRTPIKGLQFFIPSTAWFCKLCDQWIGDLHCASAHLKSVDHSKNYSNFVELNPHWEMDWMSDRQKTFEKYRKEMQSQDPNAPSQYSPHTISFQPDGCHTKIKKENATQGEENNFLAKNVTKKEKKKRDKKEKKKQKKKRSLSESSSSSSDSSSDSRVDEAKKKKRNEDAPTVQQPQKPDENDPDDRLLNQWMSVQHTSEQDRKMLEEVKNRVKTRAGERTEQRIDGRVVSREREARALLSIRNEHVRAEASVHSSKNDSKEKEKEHRSHRDKEKDRKDKDRDKSHRGRDRDDDRYRYSSSSNKVYSLADSDFKPYPSSKRETHDHNEARFEKQVSSKGKKHSSNSSNSNDSKKMPFIGKMPLYKSLGTTTKPQSKSESEPSTASEQDCIEAARKKRDEINLQLQVTMESFKEKIISSIAEKSREMDPQYQLQQQLRQQLQQQQPELFPEPQLVIPTLHSYPTLMDIPEIVHNKPVEVGGLPQTIHRIQPMTYVAPTTFSAPSTVNASEPTSTKAAASKNDLLHKDFQDALDIIFPSDEVPTKKEGEVTVAVTGEELPENTVQMDDDEMQMMAQAYPGMVMPGYISQVPGMVMGYDYSGTVYNSSGLYDGQEGQPPLPVAPKPGINNQDMEDLAMLGIDAEDVGASGF